MEEDEEPQPTPPQRPPQMRPHRSSSSIAPKKLEGRGEGGQQEPMGAAAVAGWG